MKLQINQKGGWRDVVPKFEMADRSRVLQAAETLADVMGAEAKWAYVDNFGHRVYWHADTRVWQFDRGW
jgi:hypothetical protein